MDIFTPTVSFHHGPKEGNFPNIFRKYAFLNAQFYVNSEKKCARFDDDGDYEGHSGSILFFFFLPQSFFSSRMPCLALVFIVLRKMLLRSSTFFPLSSSLALGTKKTRYTPTQQP